MGIEHSDNWLLGIKLHEGILESKDTTLRVVMYRGSCNQITSESCKNRCAIIPERCDLLAMGH